ncbi:MAG: FkbM family methyltransferase [Actinobacteria bacterium]|nr:FkbM family methyltransferase [Actinomycetota bacterium]
MSDTSATDTTTVGDGEAVWPTAAARPPLVDLRDHRRGPSRARASFERALDRLPFVEKEMPVVARIVRPGWTCVDIGAAGGTYTHLLSRRVGAAGRVHAVEPRSRSMGYLRRMRRVFRWHNVELHQLALTDHDEGAELSVPRFARTEAHLTGPVATTDRTVRTERVATTTVDALVRSRDLVSVELIKCDVEGAELQVLRGAEWTMARFRPVVVVEIEARHLARYDLSPDAVAAWFEERDYAAYRTTGGRLVPATGIVPDENDYILLPRERVAGP